ncbi:hypothetical protein GQ55_7G149600 [Panicum hallii var. hallii]|uniref:FBD domain-containing protein n=1 Tax=Panicum hallii var. hallii TaxID=1504633 RepID=A0A2T7CV82_9POAL|nr:hypothetical protein GQ55_7G149600 [Panicum hallii var. hallii]
MHFRRSPYEPWTETSVRMERFVSKLLVLHDAPCLDAFRLAASSASHDSRRHIDAWVRRAIRGNPLVLEVRNMSSDGHDLYQLPHLGSSSRWRRLKRLKLIGVSLDHSFAKLLHYWWPHLEDLVLVQCQIGFCSIESDRLNNLAIQYCTNPPADVFVIRASGLAALSLALHNNSYRNGVSLHVGNSLVRASVTLKRDEFSPRNEAMILGSLFNVASLAMKDFQAMAILDTELFDKLPTFNNLRTLTLNPFSLNSTVCDVHNFKALGRFLQKTPNMLMLTLENFWVAPTVELVEDPALQNLRTLILDSCSLHDNFGLLHHCLRNSPNLEKLIVQYCKVSDSSTGGEGNAKSKEESQNMVPLHCPKLESTELRYHGHDANIPILRRLLLGISAPKNSIKFTNMKYRTGRMRPCHWFALTARFVRAFTNSLGF